MSVINLTFDVEKPILEVWKFGLQTERIPEWQFDIAGVEGISGEIDAAGYSYTLIYHIFGRDFRSPVSVTRFEPPNLIETSGRTPIGGYFRSTTRMNAHENCTRIDWQMDYQLPLGFFGKILDFLIFKKAFRQTVRKYNENYKALAGGRLVPHTTLSSKEVSKIQ